MCFAESGPGAKHVDFTTFRNLHELGRIVQFGLERPVIRGVSFQLATYCFTVEHIKGEGESAKRGATGTFPQALEVRGGLAW
jgi:hypothetical protein